ncbi:LysR substrate-binding domain-containing protein [Inquilinus sp.]|uniref:LysR substrate-binding domain-containing protein n=1 Tax=Inquilinus sp. TaxID=1932117 RepID=UPI0031E1287E
MSMAATVDNNAGVAAMGGPSLGNAEFEFLRAFVYEQCGISLGEHKRQLVQGRLLRRLRALKLRDFQAYCELLRREPLVWFGSPDHDPQAEEPLPVALYEPGCVARGVTLEALAAAQRPYRIAYSSPSLVGLLAVVRAGLAVAVVVGCSLPEGMRVLGERDGLPPLPSLEIGLAWGARPRTPAAARLAEQIHDSVGRPEALAA